MISQLIRPSLIALVFLPFITGGCREEPAAVKRLDPKRFASSIEAFDKQTVRPEAARGGIVFTGSSSIRMWDLEKAFPDLPVLNRGFGGSVATDLMAYADRVVLRYEPRILVIYTGSNDINARLPVKQCLADYTEFLELVHEKLPATRVIVNPVKISRKRIKEMPKVHELNALLQAWCASRPWTRWVETAAYLGDEKGQPIDKYFIEDQLHLSNLGYAEWEKIIGPVLREEWDRQAAVSQMEGS